jgi:hypothetical protein
MIHTTRRLVALTTAFFLATTPTALAQGGPGGGGSGGGGCTPLIAVATVGRSDFSANWRIGVQATIRNCTAANQLLHLNVSVANSGDAPFNADTGLAPGATAVRNASPAGSTPVQLQFGRTYRVVTTLTQTTAPSTVLATSTFNVTIPAR